MKIIVYNTAAEDGGGLFVLKQFYQDVLALEDSHEWIFIVSTDAIKTKGNVLVRKYEDVKKSYFHRILFEQTTLRKILKSAKPDLVISLQNMPIKGCSTRQFTYLHQSLQYCPKKYSFFKADERRTAIRQKIICNINKKYLPLSEHIFVQTEWIKSATIKWLNVDDKKITVVPVQVNVPENAYRPYEGINAKVFFYPARAEKYKNHDVIIDAAKILHKEGVSNYKIIFTIQNEDGPYAQQLIEKSRNLPIEFVGSVPYEKIWNYYATSILLFPSYLETCGLPMLEAKAMAARVLASDMPFSHECLDDYKNADFFQYDDPVMLAHKMKIFLESPEYTAVDVKEKKMGKSLVESMLERVKS